jgi:hypothetical protein
MIIVYDRHNNVLEQYATSICRAALTLNKNVCYSDLGFTYPAKCSLLDSNLYSLASWRGDIGVAMSGYIGHSPMLQMNVKK